LESNQNLINFCVNNVQYCGAESHGAGSWYVKSALTGQNTLTTVCLPSCEYALDPKT